jgi:hypothetical protein
MYTSLGGPPWLKVLWPKPSVGNATASTATIAATTATAVDAESLLIGLLRSFE